MNHCWNINGERLFYLHFHFFGHQQISGWPLCLTSKAHDFLHEKLDLPYCMYGDHAEAEGGDGKRRLGVWRLGMRGRGVEICRVSERRQKRGFMLVSESWPKFSNVGDFLYLIFLHPVLFPPSWATKISDNSIVPRNSEFTNQRTWTIASPLKWALNWTFIVKPIFVARLLAYCEPPANILILLRDRCLCVTVVRGRKDSVASIYLDKGARGNGEWECTERKTARSKEWKTNVNTSCDVWHLWTKEAKAHKVVKQGLSILTEMYCRWVDNRTGLLLTHWEDKDYPKRLQDKEGLRTSCWGNTQVGLHTG